MIQELRFKVKLHDPKSATRDELVSQLREISKYLTLAAEDFEEKLRMLYDHEALIKKLCELSAEQRQLFDSGFDEFHKKGLEINDLIEKIENDIIAEFKGFQIMIKERNLTLSLLKHGENDLKRLHEIEIEEMQIEKREYSRLIGTAKEKIAAQYKDDQKEIELEARLMQIFEKMVGILEVLQAHSQDLYPMLENEKSAVKQFIYTGKSFDHTSREYMEKYLSKLALQVEENILQQKKLFFDPFNELARQEASPVDHLSHLFSNKDSLIDVEDIRRVEKALTDADERIVLASAIMGYKLTAGKTGSIFEKDVYDYAMKMMKNANSDLKAIKRQATFDAMTGMRNRATYEDDIKNLIKERKVFSLIMIDIDHFKSFNDEHGHLLGDKVLIEVADILIHNCGRSTDKVYRIGGEEMAFVLTETKLAGGEVMAERLRKAVESHRMTDSSGNDIVHANGSLHNLTISLGVIAVENYDFIDALKLGKEDVMKRVFTQCDSALYQSKNSGRNRVTKAYFDPAKPPKEKESKN